MTTELHKEALWLIDSMKGRIHKEDARIVESLLETCITQKAKIEELSYEIQNLKHPF